MSTPGNDASGHTAPTAALNAALEVVMAIDGPASIGSPDVISAALSAAGPIIIATNVAESLRKVADELQSMPPKLKVHYVAHLRARADQIEGGVS